MKLLLLIVLAMSTYAHADDTCHRILERAANEKAPSEALTLLGSCLATPAAPTIHQRVVLQMADISLRSDDVEDALRYLGILHVMLENEANNDNENVIPPSVQELLTVTEVLHLPKEGKNRISFVEKAAYLWSNQQLASCFRSAQRHNQKVEVSFQPYLLQVISCRRSD